jgi:hypothetical protein
MKCKWNPGCPADQLLHFGVNDLCVNKKKFTKKLFTPERAKYRPP